jgi:hypothetical protein
LKLLMPCKPSVQERALTLAATPVRMTLWSCSADSQTWSLAFADLSDPHQLGAALQELVRTAALNVNASAPQTLTLPLTVPGATPHAHSQRLQWLGQLPGGQATWMQVAVFAHGTWVFQATVLGPRPPQDAAQTFMESIRFAP